MKINYFAWVRQGMARLARSRLVLLIVVGVGVLAVAGALFWMRRQAVAQADPNTITVYTALEPEEAALYLRDFQLVFPDITVVLVQQPINQLSEQILAEQEAPQADVIWGVGLRNLLLFEWNDLLTPYMPLGYERIKPEFVDTRTPPYWVGFYRTLTAFCVNPEASARRGIPAPRSWDALIDPIYRRNLVMPNPTTSSSGLTVLLTIFELYDERDAWRYLDELHKNIVVYTPDETAACRFVDQGTYPIGLAKADTRLVNVQMIYPQEGAGWELMVGALVRKDPVRPAARTFLDWAVSKSVMQLYARQSPLTAMRTRASSPPGFPANAEAQQLPQDPSWGAANRSRILREWQRRYSDKVMKAN
jgi:iron(III) transport system substrate-binding protein